MGRDCGFVVYWLDFLVFVLYETKQSSETKQSRCGVGGLWLDKARHTGANSQGLVVGFCLARTPAGGVKPGQGRV